MIVSFTPYNRKYIFVSLQIENCHRHPGFSIYRFVSRNKIRSANSSIAKSQIKGHNLPM